jgi:hypothetical protein
VQEFVVQLLIIIGVAVAVAALLCLVALRVLRARNGSGDADDLADDIEDGPVYGIPDGSDRVYGMGAPPSGPVYGVTQAPGSAYAPQPVFGLVPTPPPVQPDYQPHRPVRTTSSIGAPRVPTAHSGAHRRDSDADEIARLHALHQTGALSDEELSALKSRLL